MKGATCCLLRLMFSGAASELEETDEGDVITKHRVCQLNMDYESEKNMEMWIKRQTEYLPHFPY